MEGFKHEAHREVYRALQEGRLTKAPCVVCGSETWLEAHHDDYSKPLEVIWFCRKHHKAHHRAATPIADVSEMSAKYWDRHQIIIPRELIDRLNAWRVRQEDLPNKCESIRRLVEKGLAADAEERKAQKVKPKG